MLVSLGWGWLIQTYCQFNDSRGTARLCPGAELLIVAPFFIILLGTWLVYYDADRAFHETNAYSTFREQSFFSRAGYAFANLRQNLLLTLFPALLMTLQQSITRSFPQTFDSQNTSLMSMASLPILFIFLPWMLPKLMGWKSLPLGEGRDRLHAKANRLGLRYRDILVWNTRGMVANAMVLGLLPVARYVVFTDRLLNELSRDETDAVLGHEIGHVKHHHMLFYALFVILSLIWISMLSEIFRLYHPVWTEQHPNLFFVAPIIILAVYIFVAFGFLSRRCERQADIFGCKAVSCDNPHCLGHDMLQDLGPFRGSLCPTGIQTFARALDHVAEINGMQKHRPSWASFDWRGKPLWIFESITSWLGSWQHSTIHRRVEYLRNLAENLDEEPRFQRRLWLLKWALIIFLLAGIVVCGQIYGWDLLLGDSGFEE